MKLFDHQFIAGVCREISIVSISFCCLCIDLYNVNLCIIGQYIVVNIDCLNK